MVFSAERSSFCCCHATRNSRVVVAGFRSRLQLMPKASCFKRVLRRSGVRKLLILNLLPALYGVGNVASRYEDATEGETSLIKYSSASLVYLPALVRSLRGRDWPHVKNGVELGLWAFAQNILSCYSPSQNTTSLLYALTIIAIPLLQVASARKTNWLTWIANILSLTGMGILEEEGHGWKGILLPSSSDPWVLINTAFAIVKVIRSESLNKNRDPAKLQAVQLAVLWLLSLLWQCVVHSDSAAAGKGLDTLQVLTLVFSGLVCSGVGSLLEIWGIRGMDSSTVTISYTTIPLWGALFSSLEQRRPLEELVTLLTVMVLITRLTYFVHVKSSETSTSCEQDTDISAVILSSQLKIPYYTNQAQALTEDLDAK